MDIKKYISSGILELYVLDELPPTERREVAHLAEQYPEVKKEILAIENALYLYSTQRAVPPPPSLETSILEKIDNLPPDNGVPTSTRTSWLTPALSALLVGALAWSGWMFFQNNDKEQELTELNTKLETQEKKCATIESDNKMLEEQMRNIRTASNHLIRMKGTDKAPDAIATVYWNPDFQKTYLDVNNMPVPPSDKQYQLWAIVDGKPVDMGVFDMDVSSDLLIEVPHVENVQAFAVTLEPKGGSVGPTLTEMYVIGEVG